MKVEQRITERFQELLNFETTIMQTRSVGGGELRHTSGGFVGRGRTYKTSKFDKVDSELVSEWSLNCLHLLKKTFGENSDHYSEFKQQSKYFDSSLSYNHVKLAFSILKSAKNNYENGYLFDARSLIQAEVFDDFLEQAKYLLNEGWFIASAVITGIVLEDSIRKLCIKNGIILNAKPKLDTMNAELSKAGVYNLLKQKQITALADLRNKAAHGQGGFTKEDVEDMIRNVRRFMEDYFN